MHYYMILIIIRVLWFVIQKHHLNSLMRNNILKDAHSVWLDGHPFLFSYRNPFRFHLWWEGMILKQLQSFSLWNWFSTDYNDTRRVGKDGTHFFAGLIISIHRSSSAEPTALKLSLVVYIQKSAHHSKQADSVSIIEILYRHQQIYTIQKCLATYHKQPSTTKIK